MEFNKNRLLSLNVHYSPESFGGATIVAEEVNRLLAINHDWEVLVLTTRNDDKFLPYHRIKYETKGVTVISLNIPSDIMNEDFTYNNPSIEWVLEEIIESFKPTVCHGHAVQNIGFNFASVMKRNNIPTILTLHDCLWICEKQFMVNNHGRYCNQKKIDPTVCLHCVENPSNLNKRNSFFKRIYNDVDQFLFPSKFHMDLHIENGFEPEKCLVSKNGITFPKQDYKKTPTDVVRFGFVGGPGSIKGAHLIQEAFSLLDGDYILKLVDAGKKVGQSWKPDFESWGLDKDKFEIIEPYDQESMDDFFSEIDVLLFPSQWKESFGLTVREALVRDVWVVATNGGGTVEDIKDGMNGTVIPLSNNSNDLLNATKDSLSKDWRNFVNDFKNEIINYVNQAEALDEIYENISVT